MEEINIDTYDMQPTIIENEETYEEPINKIYARPNENGIVIDIFSEAFEQPQPNDICIDDTNTERHGAQQYEVVDDNGFYNYEVYNGKVIERDKSLEAAKQNNISKIAELKDKLATTDYQAIKYAEGQMTDIEYAPIKVQRQLWRDEINKLEGEVQNG